jgi:hypothetical protein
MQINCGAASTRNLLLDDSYADYCIPWDDDVQPLPGCIDAYVRAFRAKPDAAAFAGAIALHSTLFFQATAPAQQRMSAADDGSTWKAQGVQTLPCSLPRTHTDAV